MKPVLLIAGAALALASTAALADGGQVFDHAAQLRAYSSTTPRDVDKQCFNGTFITGANRSGEKTVYIQSTRPAVYRLRLADGCAALNSAEKITIRANGSNLVCPGDSAEMIARTSAGAQHCRVAEVRRLSSGEVTALATAPRR